MLDTAGHSEPIFFSGGDTEFASFALGGTLGNGFKTRVGAILHTAPQSANLHFTTGDKNPQKLLIKVNNLDISVQNGWHLTSQ